MIAATIISRQAEPPADHGAAPVYANSPFFSDTPAADLARLRDASLSALASPATSDSHRQALAQMLADVDRELADRAMRVIQVDSWDLDIAHLVRENARLRRELDGCAAAGMPASGGLGRLRVRGVRRA